MNRAVSASGTAVGWSSRLEDIRWIVPIFFFSIFLLLIHQSDRFLNDPDTFWHIKVGEYIWRTGSFPTTDPFSHTFAGAPWIAKEWLSQLIFYWMYRLAGWTGVALIAILTVSSSFTLLFAWLLRRLKTTIALIIVLLAWIISVGHFLARPHVFVFPLLILFIGGLADAVERQRRPSWWLVALIALWANLHASFTIAFVILAVFGAEALFSAPVAERMRIARSWSLFGVAALLAIGVTPYGYESALMTFSLFGGNEAVQYIREWRHMEANATGALALIAALGSLAVVMFSPRHNIFRALLIGFFTYLMIVHMRFMSLFAIVTAISVADPLARRFPRLGSQAMGPVLLGERALSAITVGLMIASITFAAITHPTPKAMVAPVAAFNAARRAGVKGPVYNDYNFGGYLIFRGVKTFIDGRTDQLFLGGFMKTLYSALDNKDDKPFLAFLDRYGATWALVRAQSKSSIKLDKAPNWKRIYRDQAAAVYVKQPNKS